jgi:CRP/FNR family cyclic AMP-dependent transcriptional regulator
MTQQNSGGPKKLQKGESLFREGEMSKAMYLIRSGAIRIFKKKGESQIEIDNLRSGQIVGEMAFLDGNPRSASAEAIMDSELVEISQEIYQSTLNQTPDWLTVLFKALVARLRSTTTKLKNLESSSTAVDYKDGQSQRSFVFLSTHDCLKIATALLLAGARSNETVPEGKKCKLSVVERYAQQVMGVPGAKTTCFLETIKQTGILAFGTTSDEIILKDAVTLEQYIQFQGDENIAEASKRHDISIKGFAILSLLAKHLSRFPKNDDGLVSINIVDIIQTESKTAGRDPFRVDEFPEIANLGYASQLNIKSGSEQITTVNPDKLSRAFRMHWIQRLITLANEEKSPR